MAADAAPQRDPHASSPSAWIVRFAPHIANGASVLDLAAGSGRHAVYLARRGARVLAVDRDASALRELAEVGGVDTLVADLETGSWPLAGRRFDAIIVTRYLHRPLFDALVDGLEPDGLLLYETFALGNEAYGRPCNPDFLLRESELLEVFARRLVVIAFEQGLVAGEPPAVVQRIAAVGSARRRPLAFAV